MNSTVAMLRKIKTICDGADGCGECVLNGLFCDVIPAYWTDAEMEEMAEAIDNYKENKDDV